MFRQFAPVKEVRVLKEGRQPKGFAYVLFHTAEHAQYALESWRALEGGGMGGYGEWGAGKARVAFAREDVMHQLLSQATPDPAPTAIAQWGAHTHNAQAHRHMHPNMHPGAGSPSTGIPGPGPGHPANYPQAYGHGPAPTSAYPLASAYASAHARRSHPHSFPPHFESQGGSYVFTPSTYFHHTATDYYHDPKSHLYYSGRDGVYYRYDQNADPPFVRYNPPLPTAPHTTTAAIPPTATAGVGGYAQMPQVQGQVQVGAKGGRVGVVGGKVGVVGFGIAGKKKGVMRDIKKWAAAQEEEEEGGEKGAPPTASTSASALAPAPAPALARTKSAPAAQTPAPTLVTAAPHTQSAAPTLVPTSVATSVATPAAAPSICYLCKRQFPSTEMLQRHERESKLHKENVRKVGLQSGSGQ
ncbi:hypothetical protein B484DRAFT_132104 [Ochromonadaceae sp. CCMP2298]|nr:hypothetical protein B484DRAFT_132104 [Ochromonadaceae sp. CCMP2298]